MSNKQECNIYHRLCICVNEADKTYYIEDRKTNIILYFVKDLETAMAIKKAYCDGYVDGKNEVKSND